MTRVDMPVIDLPRRPGYRSADWASRPLALLRSGIPLTLLLDLAEPAGPASELIYREEHGVLLV